MEAEGEMEADNQMSWWQMATGQGAHLDENGQVNAAKMIEDSMWFSKVG